MDYVKFEKRYDKFKKNNLPTPFFDEERQTLEYVYFDNGLNVLNNLTESLGRISLAGFYYSFTCKCFSLIKKGNKYIEEVHIGHNHAHSFEEVVKCLYDFPESFKISKKEEELYSKQELEYLRRVQKYLLFIGMKDIDSIKKNNERYRNNKHKKYENVMIYGFKNNVIKDILDSKRNFRVIRYYKGYKERLYNKGEYQALLVDEKDNFKLLVEFTKEEVKYYKDIKKLYKNPDMKDSDKVIVCYFKEIERF